MADEPYSITAATVEEGKPHAPHPDTNVDIFAHRIEDQVSNVMGNLSSWWSGVHAQVCWCVFVADI